jgi:micrococcal nuclease
MKKNLLVAAAILLAVAAQAQQEIKIEELGKHVGDSVTVCTKIYSGIFLDRSNGTPTLLNAGGLYPNAPLTIFIGADARKQFKEAPEVFFKNKEVCVTGKVILYKDKPEIVVYEEKQIVIKQ